MTGYYYKKSLYRQLAELGYDIRTLNIRPPFSLIQRGLYDSRSSI